MARIFVKPKDGKRVIDPATRRELAPEGKNVPCGEYWKRRFRDGDIEMTEAVADKVDNSILGRKKKFQKEDKNI